MISISKRSAARGVLLVMLTVGTPVLAQPKEEPVPEGVFKLSELRIFLESPVWFAWKLPASKFLLAYVQAPAKEGEPPVRQVVVLDPKGKLDAKRTEALKAALAPIDPDGKCLETGEGRMPVLMPLGAKGLALQPVPNPGRACLFTWNAKTSVIDVRAADSAKELCGEKGCPPEQCWWTANCWLPEGPDLDLARRGFASSPLSQSLVAGISAPGNALLAATLPGSGRVLLWVPSWRLADAEDPSKNKDSRIIVFDPVRKSIDPSLTRKLAKALEDATDECQGLGTITELRSGARGVTLHQSYEHGDLRLSCSSTITWNGTSGKFSVEVQPATSK
jgi:hypothetical protein